MPKTVQNKDPETSDKALLGRIISFAVPILVMNILQLLFNAADMIVVGRFSGSAALAAVGASGSLINLLVNLLMGLSVGTSVIVAVDYGAERPDQVSRSVHTSIAVSIIGGVITMAAGLLFCAPLLRWMGTPADILPLSVVYMRIYFIGIPGAMVYNFAAAILRAVGDSRRPMYYLLISGILNVLLNLIFVISLGMGVAGVAYATSISQYTAMVMILVCLIRSSGAIRLVPRRIFPLDHGKLKQILRIGLPAGLQNILFSFSNVLIQSAINSFGSALVAASSAASNIEGLIGTTMNALYNAAITFTGQSMGAKKYRRIDSIAKLLTMLIFIAWAIAEIMTILFGRQMMALFTSDPDVIRLGVLRLDIMMAVYFFCGIMVVFPGLTRSMGYSITPMICTLAGACLLRIVWLVTVFRWDPSIPVLFLCYPVTWMLAGLGQVGIFLFARNRLRKKPCL